MTPDDDWLVIYEAGWSGYEEHDQATLWYTMSGDYYLHETSHNVYTGSHEAWTQLTETQAIQFIIDKDAEDA